MTDEIFLTQSDPMKVLPPADDQVVCNEYGTVFMNAKTYHKLTELQSVRDETINSVLDIIREKEKGFGQPWSREKELFNFGWVSCAQEIGKAVDALWGDEE